jgi:cell division protein FtsB
MSDEGVASALAGLDARVWAQLLRGVRLIAEVPEPVAGALAGSTGELASGAPRRALCDAIAAAPSVLAALRGDDALPAAVHAAIGPGTEVPASRPDAELDDERADEGGVRAEERSRELRRTLEEERRRREGAEARASAAEARADVSVAEAERLAGRVAALESDLAASRDEIDQAAARAERRAMARVESLERELAAERSALASLRREHDRTRAALADLQQEADALRERASSQRSPSSVAGGDRPLVLPEGIDEGTTEAARWLASRAAVLLVDGYNAALLLRQNHPLDEQRRWLVERMRPLAARGGAAPVVIFDGAGVTGRMRDTGGVDVRFTSSGVIADDEIVFAVAATDQPVLVVTDDAELQERVRSEGGNVVGVVHLPGIIDA